MPKRNDREILGGLMNALGYREAEASVALDHDPYCQTICVPIPTCETCNGTRLFNGDPCADCGGNGVDSSASGSGSPRSAEEQDAKSARAPYKTLEDRCIDSRREKIRTLLLGHGWREVSDGQFKRENREIYFVGKADWNMYTGGVVLAQTGWFSGGMESHTTTPICDTSTFYCEIKGTTLSFLNLHVMHLRKVVLNVDSMNETTETDLQ